MANTADMPVFNVAHAVVACVQAPDAATASNMLRWSLERQGFVIFEPATGLDVPGLPPFEAEEGTELTALP